MVPMPAVAGGAGHWWPRVHKAPFERCTEELLIPRPALGPGTSPRRGEWDPGPEHPGRPMVGGVSALGLRVPLVLGTAAQGGPGSGPSHDPWGAHSPLGQAGPQTALLVWGAAGS